MTPEEITAFFERRGHRVVQTASCWWYNEYHQGRVYQSFPIHRLINPGPEEVADLFRSIPRALGIRYIGPLKSKGLESSIWVCRKPYDLSTLAAKSRNQTRRGLENCQVRKIPWHELEAITVEADTDTLRRHQLSNGRTRGFGSYVKDCAAYEAWGAFVGDELAAFMVTLWVEDWVHILIQRSVSKYLNFRPNNALVFSVASEVLARPGVSAISYGLEPLRTLESLEHFKLSMGFVKEPICQSLVVARWLRPVLNAVTCRAIEIAASLRPRNSRLQKVAGVCQLIRQS